MREPVCVVFPRSLIGFWKIPEVKHGINFKWPNMMKIIVLCYTHPGITMSKWRSLPTAHELHAIDDRGPGTGGLFPSFSRKNMLFPAFRGFFQLSVILEWHFPVSGQLFCIFSGFPGLFKCFSGFPPKVYLVLMIGLTCASWCTMQLGGAQRSPVALKWCST